QPEVAPEFAVAVDLQSCILLQLERGGDALIFDFAQLRPGDFTVQIVRARSSQLVRPHQASAVVRPIDWLGHPTPDDLVLAGASNSAYDKLHSRKHVWENCQWISNSTTD